MHYAIYLPNFGPYGDARVGRVLHLGQDFPVPVVDPWVALAAARLSRYKLGNTATG